MNFFFSLVLCFFCFSCVAFGHLSLLSDSKILPNILQGLFGTDESNNKKSPEKDPAKYSEDRYYPNRYSSKKYRDDEYETSDRSNRYYEIKKPLPAIQRTPERDFEFSRDDKKAGLPQAQGREMDFIRKIAQKLESIKDLKTFDKNVNYYFQKSARQGYIQAMSWLLSQINELKPETVSKAFAGAAYYGRNETVIWMLKRGIKPDVDAINRACVSSVNTRGKVMKLLVNYDFKPNSEGVSETFVMAAFKGDLDLMSWMLKNKLYPDQVAVNSAYFAASNKKPEMLVLLMNSRLYPEPEVSDAIFANAVASNDQRTALMLLDLPKNPPSVGAVKSLESFFEQD